MQNVVIYLASKSAIRKTVMCTWCINWLRRRGEDVKFLASYIRPWSGEKNTTKNKQNSVPLLLLTKTKKQMKNQTPKKQQKTNPK